MAKRMLVAVALSVVATAHLLAQGPAGSNSSIGQLPSGSPAPIVLPPERATAQPNQPGAIAFNHDGFDHPAVGFRPTIGGGTAITWAIGPGAAFAWAIGPCATFAWPIGPDYATDPNNRSRFVLAQSYQYAALLGSR